MTRFYGIHSEQATGLFGDATWASKPTQRLVCAGSPETLRPEGSNTPQR